MQELDLRAHLGAQLGVEIRQRLVEQEDLGLADDGAAHRHPLPLAARELRRAPVEQVAEMENVARLSDPGVDLGLRALGDLEGKAEVLAHAHVRVERVGLEHHGDVARAGRQVVDDLAADPDRACGNLLEPGDHPQRRRLAATRRTHQRDEFAVGDRKIDRPHRFDSAVALDQLFERDRRHRVSLSPRRR